MRKYVLYLVLEVDRRDRGTRAGRDARPAPHPLQRVVVVPPVLLSAHSRTRTAVVRLALCIRPLHGIQGRRLARVVRLLGVHLLRVAVR